MSLRDLFARFWEATGAMKLGLLGAILFVIVDPPPTRKLAPNVTIASLRAGQCARDPARIEPILEGLRLAGLPEE